MTSAQGSIGPLYWQAVATITKSQLPSLSLGRSRPLLVSTSSSLAAPVAGPSTLFASSQRFVRDKSSTSQPAFKVGDMYSSDPILCGRAKVLNEWNDKHQVDAALFENDSPDEYAALRLAAGDAKESPGVASSSTDVAAQHPLLAAVQGGRWADARAEFQTLHSAGTTVPFNMIYLQAALESLSSVEIQTAEDRLEWFILWASLLPVDSRDPIAHLPVNLLRQHSQVMDQLLCYTTHIGHITRALMLFCEKGLGRVYGRRLLPFLTVACKPKSRAVTIVESMCACAGWPEDSAERSESFNTVIHRLFSGGRLQDAIKILYRARETSVPFFYRGFRRPTIDISTYQFLLNQIERKRGSNSSMLLKVRSLARVDYPDQLWLDLNTRNKDNQLVLVTNGRPSVKDLPRAIFLLSRSTTRKSVTALSNILEALYMTPVPRPRLVALLYRRLTQPFERKNEDSLRMGEVGQRTWITAEMRRLIRLGRPADALSLFAARCQWFALPTSDIWGAFRDYRPELSPKQVALIAQGQGLPVYDPSRKLLAGPKLTEAAYSAIVAMHGPNVELLTQDYREFLSFFDSTQQQPEPTIPAAAMDVPPDGEQDTSLFEHLPEALASVDKSLYTPWSAFDIGYDLPDGSQAGPGVWSTWVSAFGRIDVELATAVLRDMRQRAVPHDCRVYGHLLVSMIKANELDRARATFADLVRQGGISFEDVCFVTTKNPGENRPTTTSVGEDNQFPPITAWLYVRLIREYALSQNTTYSFELEDEMRAAGFPLSDLEKGVMVEAYAIRHSRRVREARDARAPIPDRIQSPWGKPETASGSNVAYIRGELTGVGGRSYAQPSAARQQSNTLREEAYPLRARTLQMAADNLRDEGERKAEEKRRRRVRQRQETLRLANGAAARSDS